MKKIDCVILNQKGEEIYLFAMDARSLLKLCYVNPQTRDNPDEIQRLLDKNRLRKIAEFIRQPASLIPNNIVVNLSPEVNIVKTSTGKIGTISFPSEEGGYGYILDGQHRLKSFELTEGINFDLAVVAFKNIDHRKAGKIFVDINTNQKQADKTLIYNIREAIGDLPDGEERAAIIVNDLDELDSSPLKGKVRRFEDDKKKWINSPSLIVWVTKLVDLGGLLQGKSRNDQTEIIINFLNAFKDVFPYTHSSQKEYILWKPSGIQIMFELFSNVFQRVLFKKGADFTKDNFAEAIEPIKNFTIEGNVPWENEVYVPYTSGAGRSRLIKILQNELPPSF